MIQSRFIILTLCFVALKVAGEDGNKWYECDQKYATEDTKLSFSYRDCGNPCFIRKSQKVETIFAYRYAKELDFTFYRLSCSVTSPMNENFTAKLPVIHFKFIDDLKNIHYRDNTYEYRSDIPAEFFQKWLPAAKLTFTAQFHNWNHEIIRCAQNTIYLAQAQ